MSPSGFPLWLVFHRAIRVPGTPTFYSPSSSHLRLPGSCFWFRVSQFCDDNISISCSTKNQDGHWV